MDDAYHDVIELLTHQAPESLAQLLKQFSTHELEIALLKLVAQTDVSLTLRSRAVRYLSSLGLLNDRNWMVIIPVASTGLLEEWFTTWADPTEKTILSAEHIRALFDSHRLPKSSNGVGKAIHSFIQRGAGYTSRVFIAGANYPYWEIKYDCIKTIILLDDADSLHTLAAFSTMSYWKARKRILEYIQNRYEENRLLVEDIEIVRSILEQFINDGKTEPKTPTMSLARKLFSSIFTTIPKVENFCDSVVAVMNSQNCIMGTGFLVGKRIVLTCAHVVEDIPNRQIDRINLCFSNGLIISASVESGHWHEAEDIAVLTLEKDPPRAAIPLPLSKLSLAYGYHFRSYGFPKVEPIIGLHATGDIVGVTKTEQGLSLLQLRSPELALGHSGAPVWDEQTQCVVGMVSQVWHPGSDTKNRDTAFAIPAETLLQVDPKLSEYSNPLPLIKNNVKDEASIIINDENLQSINLISFTGNLPFGKYINGILEMDDEKEKFSKLMRLCLEKIASDQFDKGDANGAWAKSYPGYIKFLFQDTMEPNDFSLHESISISRMIVTNLMKYTHTVEDNDLTDWILPKFRLLRDYLLRHYDSKVGGFGILSRPKLRGPINIDVGLRHTIQALLILWMIGLDSESEGVFQQTGKYLRDQLDNIDFKEERVYSLAVVHRFLTLGASRLLIINQIGRRSKQKQIENMVVERFDQVHNSWDMDKDPPRTTRIDNALYILSDMPVQLCLDSDCKEVLTLATRKLIQTTSIKINDQELAIPFLDGGKPDIGTTLQLVNIVMRNPVLVTICRNQIKAMLSFCYNPDNYQRYSDFRYSWHLSSIFEIASRSALSNSI